MFNGKTIVITVGTGFFARKFTTTLLARYKRKKIIIFSLDEYTKQQRFDDRLMRYSIQLINRSNNLTNATVDKGQLVKQGFESVLDTNPHFSTIDETRHCNLVADL